MEGGEAPPALARESSATRLALLARGVATPALSASSLDGADKENAPQKGGFMAATASSRKKEASAGAFRPAFAPKPIAEDAADDADASAGCVLRRSAAQRGCGGSARAKWRAARGRGGCARRADSSARQTGLGPCARRRPRRRGADATPLPAARGRRRAR